MLRLRSGDQLLIAGRFLFLSSRLLSGNMSDRPVSSTDAFLDDNDDDAEALTSYAEQQSRKTGDYKGNRGIRSPFPRYKTDPPPHYQNQKEEFNRDFRNRDNYSDTNRWFEKRGNEVVDEYAREKYSERTSHHDHAPPVFISPRPDTETDNPNHHPSREPYEGGFVSVDESPYRLREILQVKYLWRESMMNPGKIFEDLMSHLKPLSVWQNMHAYLVGGKTVKEIQATKRGRARYEKEIKGIRDAVVGGDFMWRGRGGIFIQGEMRKGMEPRIYRSDIKDMEELLEKQKRRIRKMDIDEEHKLTLEAFFQDRLVIEVMRILLEPVFEPTFSQFSHGFRPGRTQHTALKQVRRDFADAMWLFRSDFRGVFELMLENRRKFTTRLRELIEPRVGDPEFLDLLISGINCNAILSDYEINPPEEGYSPLNNKCGIIPLLCNIYFDPMDKWIEERIGKVNYGKYRRINPERAALILRGEEKIADELPPLDPHDPVFRRLCYSRFADDFVIGISGPRELAQEIQREFWEYADTTLRFPLPDVALKHVRTEVRYLGHTLKRRVIMPRKTFLEQFKHGLRKEHEVAEVELNGRMYGVPEPKPDAEEEAARKIKEQDQSRAIEDTKILNISRSTSAELFSSSPREILSIDGEVDKMVRLLARAGYCHKNGDPQPNFKHLHFPQSETNMIVRRMLLSICDFYRVARNRQRIVHYCSYILRHSVAKMYAAKFKLRSRAKVFKRGGRHLSDRIKVGKGYVGKIDPDTGRAMEEYAELPYARLSEIPKPDLSPLPKNWEPEIIHILNEKLLGDIPRF